MPQLPADSLSQARLALGASVPSTGSHDTRERSGSGRRTVLGPRAGLTSSAPLIAILSASPEAAPTTWS